eukprot:3797673-Pyramimonas_sp.AAC.1
MRYLLLKCLGEPKGGRPRHGFEIKKALETHLEAHSEHQIIGPVRQSLWDGCASLTPFGSPPHGSPA